MNHRSLVFQLAVWHALLLGAVFVLAGATSLVVLQQYLKTNVGDSNTRRLDQVEAILRAVPASTDAATIAQAIETRLAPEFNSRFIRVTRSPGTLVFRSGQPSNRSFDPDRVPAATHRVTDDSQQLMIDTRTVAAPSGEYLVEAGVSVAMLEEVLRHMRALLSLLLPVLLVIATAGGYLLVSRALRTVDGMTQTAERISLQNLALRLPVIRSGDALERLSIALNTMLGRLSESVQTSRRFVADASHELRTPLTVIKGELQVLVGEPQWDEGDARDRLGSVLEEVAALEHLVAGLLTISRLDAGHTATAWTEIELAKKVANTADQMRLLAEERGIEIDLQRLEPAVVRGDPAQLRQVVVNLLDNAVRFTPRGGHVSLVTSSDETGSVLEVSDTGIGIPPAHLPHVFDRFYRVDEARSRDAGGDGLGLSIVKSICLLHGAQIDVRSETGVGSCFRIWFPRRNDVLDAAQRGVTTS